MTSAIFWGEERKKVKVEDFFHGFTGTRTYELERKSHVFFGKERGFFCGGGKMAAKNEIPERFFCGCGARD